MSTFATLALNGETVRLKNLRITLSQQFPDKDQSGGTSSTAKSEEGAKGKELRVAGEISFRDEKIVKRILEMANATETNGERKRYRVAHTLARAVNFREGTFSGQVDISQQDGRMSYGITFTIAEYLSVAEKKEARAVSKATAKKQVANASGGAGSSDTVTATEDERMMTWFESKVLKPLNDRLAPSGGDAGE